MDIQKSNIIVFLILLLLVLSSITIIVAYNKQETIATDSVEIRLKQFKFTPGVIRLKYGQEITLKVVSMDVTHGFSIKAFDIDIEVDPFSRVDVVLNANQYGKFKIVCSVPCGSFHPYMQGELKILPGIQFSFSILVLTISAIGIMTWHFKNMQIHSFIDLMDQEDP